MGNSNNRNTNTEIKQWCIVVFFSMLIHFLLIIPVSVLHTVHSSKINSIVFLPM